MANYYTDHPELEFHLHHPLMKRIVELKERNFEDKDKFEDAPVDYDDAIENYHRILEIMRTSTPLARQAFGVSVCPVVMVA